MYKPLSRSRCLQEVRDAPTQDGRASSLPLGGEGSATHLNHPATLGTVPLAAGDMAQPGSQGGAGGLLGGPVHTAPWAGKEQVNPNLWSPRSPELSWKQQESIFKKQYLWAVSWKMSPQPHPHPCRSRVGFTLFSSQPTGQAAGLPSQRGQRDRSPARAEI